MKTRFTTYVTAALLCTLFLLNGCEDQWKNYAKDSFAGKWQLKEMVTADNVRATVDTVFYNFDKGVVKLQALNATGTRIDERFGLYTFTKDSIFMEMKNPYDSAERMAQYYGWDGITIRLKIVKETRSEFVLANEKQTFYFRKF